MDFTKAARVSISTKDLSNTASRVSGQGKTLGATPVPEAVRTSMIEQGMNTQGTFSPGTPISPFEPVGTPPQQFQFQIGQNIVQQPRSTEEISFDTMRNVLKNYDVAQMCIENRLDQLKFLDWEIVRRDDKDKTDYSTDIKKVEAFLHKPDGFTLFDDWLSMVGNDLLSFDAPAIFKHKTRGGKLGALECIDGTTITPLLDGRGMIPKPPAPAYIQYTYGMPRYWLTSDSLIYRPWRRRSNTVYGYPPVEWLLMNINQDIRQQYYFLQYFTDGSVPDVFAETPEVISADTDKIRQFQQYYDAVMLGDQSQRHKVKWIPAGSKITRMKDQNFDIEYPTWLFNKTLAAFKTAPSELGFTENVNKSSGDSQENVTYRRSIRPMAKYMEALMNEVLVELGYPHLAFSYQNLGEEEDKLVAAQVREIDIRNGVISPDQAAEEIYGIQPDPNNPTPRVFMTGSTFMTLEDAIVNSKAMAQKALADAQNAANPPQPQVNDGLQGKDGKTQQNGNTEATQQNDKKTQPDVKEQLPEADKAKRPNDAKKLFKAEDDEEKKKHVLPETDYLAMSARQDALQEVIASFFQTQPKELAKHIIDGIRNEQVSAENAPSVVDKLLQSYGWEGWEKHLKPAVYQALVETMSQGGTEAAKAFEVDLTYSMINPKAVSYAEKRAAELVGTGVRSEYHIADSTRDFIRNTVTEAVQNGDSMEMIVKTLTDEYAFSDSRAMTIARTETALAYNKGTIIGYRSADVPAVVVIDGDSDAECAAANGQTWSLDYAEENPVSHPRCVRHFSGLPRKWFDGNYDME